MDKITGALLALPPQFPGLARLDRETVYLAGCSKFDQFCCTWRGLVEPSTYCPFCREELHRRNRVVLRRSEDWILLENEFPRTDVEKMYLVVPTHHVVDADELDSMDAVNIHALWQYCRRELGCASGARAERYGDPRDHAGTIEHFHVNVYVPKREGGMSIPLAKKLDGERQHRWYYAKLLEFRDQVMERGGAEWLFSREGVETTQPKMVA
jgi:diadenosine tetraphosphate (Ap4A) HIT family hydrolase